MAATWPLLSPGAPPRRPGRFCDAPVSLLILAASAFFAAASSMSPAFSASAAASSASTCATCCQNVAERDVESSYLKFGKCAPA